MCKLTKSEILSQCISMSNNQNVHFKYLKLLFVNDTLIKLKK